MTISLYNGAPDGKELTNTARHDYPSFSLKLRLPLFQEGAGAFKAVFGSADQTEEGYFMGAAFLQPCFHAHGDGLLGQGDGLGRLGGQFGGQGLGLVHQLFRGYHLLH